MTAAIVIARINQAFPDEKERVLEKRIRSFFNNRLPVEYTGGYKTKSMTTKRKVTENDLGLHPQLSERGVKLGDDHSFSIDGFPVFDESDGKIADEDGGTEGADASGESLERELTAEDLEKYPALVNAGATVGQMWGFDTGNGDPVFPQNGLVKEENGNVKRLLTPEDLEKFPELVEKGLTIEDELEFDQEGNPLFDSGEE